MPPLVGPEAAPTRGERDTSTHAGMGLSRRAHEQLQEIVTWGGSIVTLGAFYFLFIAPARMESGAPRRIPVRDLLAVKEGAVVPGLLGGQEAAHTEGASTGQLR